MTATFEVFPWNDNFETGVTLIDDQHKRLVHLLNILGAHLIYQAELPELNNVFNELAEYASYHFQTEEDIWHQYLPGDIWETAHSQIHDSFITEVLRLRKEEATKPLHKVVEDILSFLTHWLAFHILESDMRMAKVVLAVQSGLPLTQAKVQAEKEMSGAMKVLIETVLSMYDTLSTRTLQLMKEVVDRQKAESKLRLVANAIENTLESICITDANANLIDVNPAFCQTTQCSYDEVLGKNLKTLKSGLNDEKLSADLWNTIAEKGHWSGEVWSRSKQGDLDVEWLTLSSIKDDQGVVSNYVGVFSNISNLIQQQKKMERMASHDALTGLPNRVLLGDRMELAIAHAERTRTLLAICYIDLDNFKPVNDLLGHAAGDFLLREVSKRLLNSMRGNDTVARLGGDEFVILIGDLKNPQDCTDLLDRLLLEISLPVTIGLETATVTGSIGISFFPQDADNPEALLHHADKAMYQAKNLGKSRYCFHDSSLTMQREVH
ncbi:MAG: bacteriohemerythrin [Gallionellaceae bacterium]